MLRSSTSINVYNILWQNNARPIDIYKTAEAKVNQNQEKWDDNFNLCLYTLWTKLRWVLFHPTSTILNKKMTKIVRRRSRIVTNERTNKISADAEKLRTMHRIPRLLSWDKMNNSLRLHFLLNIFHENLIRQHEINFKIRRVDFYCSKKGRGMLF